MKKITVLAALLFLSTGCTLAPLSNLYTARSQGKGNGELGVGAVGMTGSNSGFVPVAKFDYGITENFDLGVKYETYDFGLNAKYALLNNKSGLSFALAASYGSTLGGNYWYVGPVISVKAGFFEPYFSARYNQVSWGQASTTAGSFTVTAPSSTINYMHYTAGAVLWPTDFIGLDLEYSSLASTQSGVSFSSNGFLAGALIIKF